MSKLDARAYALEVTGHAMVPTYRDGTVIVVSPTTPPRCGDRVVVKTKGGELMAKETKASVTKDG